MDTTRFSPRKRDESLRSELAPNGELLVGYVGRLAPEKHVERLAALAGAGDVQVVIVGDGVDRAKLQSAMPTAVFTGALYGEDLATARKDLPGAEKELEDLPDRARRAGALPGWLRE